MTGSLRSRRLPLLDTRTRPRVPIRSAVSTVCGGWFDGEPSRVRRRWTQRVKRLLSVALAAAAGWSMGVASLASATPASASVAATVVASAKAKVVAVKSPIGTCKRGDHIIYAPDDRNQICAIRNLVLGHAFPKPKASGYLQRTVAKLKKGVAVTYLGKTYRVAWVKSVPKAKLPKTVLTTSDTDRFLVTCDTRSGYVKHHAKNNLVVRLTLVA